MLDTQKDRLDYGEKLQPPEGYELSYALATTFSLELGTLLSLPIALCFHNTLEGNFHSEKLALLEAVGQLNGRLKVFFQQGNIKVPSQFNRLFTLLEPCLAPVKPEHMYSSFHPKMWLLRYEATSHPGRRKRDVRYRLIVLSRNLTWDRSWDLAVTLEGVPGSAATADNDGLLDLLRELNKSADDFTEGFAHFMRELPKVAWERPSGFTRSLATLFGGPGAAPLEFGGKTHAVLVMSPFLHPESLAWLRQRGETHWLLSRAEELDRLGPDQLRGWDCYSLNERIVSADEENDGGSAQDLHAKLFVIRSGATSHWHFGSANATKAALGNGTELPRNIEFMLRLSGGTGVTPEHLLRELVGEEGKPTGIFIPHQFREVETVQEALKDQARPLVHALITAQWKVQATELPDGSYQCELRCPTEQIQKLTPKGYVVEVGQIATGSFQPIQAQVVWNGLAPTQVSAFLPIQVRAVDGRTPEFRLMIKAELCIVGGDNRQQRITQELIDTPSKIVAYVRLLLQPDVEKSELFDLDMGPRFGGGEGFISLILEGPLFESLLRSAARRPDQLHRIDQLLHRLAKAEVEVPPEFSTLWKQFRKLIQETRR